MGCEHEYWYGICLLCEQPDPDYDPTPDGPELVTDPDTSPTYPWNQKKGGTGCPTT